MDENPRKIITLKDIARRTKLALSTVSYALRNHPRIPEPTRRRVQAAALELGYRPNPRIASLMAHIRRAHSRPAGERIAFIWVHTSREQSAGDPFLRQVLLGARQRAEQAGFALEEFWTNDRGMNDRRLQQILIARGIVGLVLSPVLSADTTLTLDWDWGVFAAAVVGNVTWVPELHHAGHHHFLAMRLALSELARLGCRRPAVFLEPKSNERAKRAWEGAFLAHHPGGARPDQFVRIAGDRNRTPVATWLKQRRPDALIVSETSLLQWPGIRAALQALAVPVITLYWSSDTPRGIGGIDQGYDRIAAHAVDLVVAQLNNNERGVPDLPRTMLFPGLWMPPARPRKR